MNTFKKWTFLVLGTTFGILSFVAATNLIVDPHGVFHKDLSRRYQAPNLSYQKVNNVLQRGHAFDSFVFGSSRVANIDIRNIPGGRWYNMFLASALPQEHLQHLRFLLDNGVPIKNVMIGLDDFSFIFDPRDHLSELDIQPHPGVSGKQANVFYAEYLFKSNRLFPLVRNFIGEIAGKKMSSDASRCRFDVINTGMVLCSPDREEAIENNREAHVRSSVFAQPWGYRYLEGDHVAAALGALDEIVALAKKNGIRLVLFINPIHKATYLHSHMKRFAEFKRGLASIAPYYDFSGLNSVTTDNYYYYETSHFRLRVGDMMLNVMLGAPDVSVPRDFGVLVTPQNIEAHLSSQCQEIISVIGRERLSDHTRKYASSCAQPRSNGTQIHAAAR